MAIETESDALSLAGRDPAHSSVPWVYLSSAVFLLSGAVFYVYLARAISSTELGSVVVLAAIGAIMSVAFSLGVGSGFLHFLSFYLGQSNPRTIRSLVRAAFFLALLLGAASGLLTAALSAELSQVFFHTSAYASTVAFLGLFTGFATAFAILQSVLIGLQRFVVYAAITIVGYVTTYGSAIAFLSIRPSVESIVFGWTFGNGLACVLYVAAILRFSRNVAAGRPDEPAPRLGAALFRSLFLYSLPLFVSAVFTTGTQYVDRLVLASVANLSSVGVYNYALLLSGGSLFLVSPFSTFLVPKFSESFGRSDSPAIRSLASRAATLIVLIYVPAGLGVAAIGPFLLRVLAGPSFVVASLPLAILVWISAACIPYAVLGSVASGIRRTILWAEAAGLSLLANIAVSLALIPTFGMVGAALGNSSMVWVPFVVFYLQLRRTGLIVFDLGAIGRIWLAAAIMFFSVWGPLELLHFDLVFVPVFVLIGIGVLLAALRLLGAVTEELGGLLLRVLPKWLRGLRPIVNWIAT